MKKIIFLTTVVAGLAVLMAACNKTASTKDSSKTDTTGLAQFQAWKAMNNSGTPVKKVTSATKRAVSSSSNGYITSSSAHEAKVKKGWSKAAKYSAIGGGTGAILGAVINKKNRVAGAVVGAVIGGGVGFGIGHSKDKKEGRY